MSTQLCPPAAPPHAAGPPHAMAADELLASRARAGDLSAFGVMVERHRPAMLARTRRVVGPDAAEDAVQLALVNAWRALRSGCEVDNVRGWLLTIAHRCALQWLRDRREAPGVISELLPGGVTPVEALDTSIRTREVLRAVSSLPDDERHAFVATAIHGRSGRATASALGVSEGMVRQLVFRARARVRDAAQLGLPAAWLPHLLAPLHARARGAARWAQLGSDAAPAQAGRLGGRIALVLAAGALLGGAPAAIHGLEGSGSAQHASGAGSVASPRPPAALGGSGTRPVAANGSHAASGALRGGPRAGAGAPATGSPSQGATPGVPGPGGAPYVAGSRVGDGVRGDSSARTGTPHGGSSSPVSGAEGLAQGGLGGAVEHAGGATSTTVEKVGQLTGHGTEAVGETVKGVGETVKGVGQTVTGAGETVGKAGETVGKVGETVTGTGEAVKGVGEKVTGGLLGG